MTEEKKKAKAYLYQPALVEGFNTEDFATSNISLNAEDVPSDVGDDHYDGMKFVVACKREKVADHGDLDSLSDAFQRRWNLDLQGVLDVFYSAAFTRPQYKTAAKDAIEAQDWDAAHRAAQTAIDEYQFNVKKSRTTVTKAQVQQVSSLQAKADALGITIDELIERAAALG